MDVNKLTPILFKIAFDLCKNEATAEDIVQETFLAVLINNIEDEGEIKNICKKISEKTYRCELNAPSKPIKFIFEVNKGREENRFIDIEAIQEKTKEVIDENVNNIKKDDGEKKYLPFELQRAFAHTLNLKTSTEWFKLYDKGGVPNNIPRNPKHYRIKEWKGWLDFLGVPEFLPFEEARKFVIEYLVPKGITTNKKYIDYGQKGFLPENIPIIPSTFSKYKSEWKGWDYWLGRENIRRINRSILSYEEAKEYVRDYLIPFGIDSADKYLRLVDPPDCLPVNLCSFYKNKGWISSSDFFGTNKQPIKKIEYKDYKTTREWVRLNLRIHGITSRKKFRAYLKGEFPDAPEWPKDFSKGLVEYFKSRNECVSENDFFGTVRKLKDSKILWDHKTAKEWCIKNLSHIDFLNESTWKKYANEKLPLYSLPEFPLKMPKDPAITYYKRNQWKGWPDFLGRESKESEALMRYNEKEVSKRKEKKNDKKVIEKLKQKGVIVQDSIIVLNTNKPLSGKQLKKILENKKRKV